MENELELFKQKILEKKDLRGIPDDFLDDFLNNFQSKHRKLIDKLKEKNYNEKSKEFDEVKKTIRKKLREVHGVFTKNALSEEKQKMLLDTLRAAKKEKNFEKENQILKKIMKSHRSTQERIDNYLDVYTSLLKDVEFEEIIDLGCGYNPFSYKQLEKIVHKKPKYLAVDINKKDSAFIQSYFNIEDMNGVSIVLDLTDRKALYDLERESKNSVCFMFKLLDSLEARKRGSSEQLFESIKSKAIIVSFPLKSIGGKANIKSERKWFLNIIQRNDYKTKEKIIGNEKYYLLTKTL